MTDGKDAPYAEFGERLAALRKGVGMSRQQLGDLCGVAPSTIINYERGKRIPYADTAVRMAQVFQMTVEQLLGVENPKVAMTTAEALDRMQSINGKKGADRLRRVYREAANLAGGDLTEEQLLEFSLEMSKMAILAQQRLRKIHTSKKFQAAVEVKEEETAQAVRELDDTIVSLVGGDE